MAHTLWLAASVIKGLLFLMTSIIPALTFKAYKFFDDARFLQFGAGFSLIAAGFLSESVGAAFSLIINSHAYYLPFLIISEFAFVGGLIAIIVAYLKVNNWWERWLLVIISLFAATTSIWNVFLYELLIISLLSYIVAHLSSQIGRKAVTYSLIGFSLILASHVAKILILAFYALFGTLSFDLLHISTSLLVLGFLMIIYSFARVLSQWRKKGAV